MKSISKALIVAQDEMGKLVKDAKNPHFKSSYATLSNVIDVAKKCMHDAGLCVFEYTEMTEAGNSVQCLELVHAESGEAKVSKMPLRVRDPENPQQIGSAQTYARRYMWSAMAGLAPQDDDGEAASEPARKPAAPSAFILGLKRYSKELGKETVSKVIADHGHDAHQADAIPAGPQKRILADLKSAVIAKQKLDELGDEIA